jgi:prepilin-type N-terminal cleavage/methylation domain-containing protein
MKSTRKILRTLGDGSGFTLVEVLVASMILVVALLTLASMFPMGYRQITDAGRMTAAVTGARHILEDVGDIPFNNISNINGVDTASNTGVIAGLGGTEAALARRWRYMLAGSGNGFTFTGAETTAWGTVQPFGGRAVVQITDLPCNPARCPTITLRQATVTVTMPGLPSGVTMSTVIVSLF